MTAPPLLSRPLDLLYVAFFVMHIPASLLVDFQAFYPPAWTPVFVKDIAAFYLRTYGDPVLGGGMGLHSRSIDVVWLKSFFYIEGLFQFPVFFIGIWALYYGHRAWYPLLIAYGASTVTTLVPCMAYLVAYPSSVDARFDFATMTNSQKVQVISMMSPWVIIPTLMSVDLSLRVARVLRTAEHIVDQRKTQ